VNVDAVVLAGGAATRFGGDKLATPLDGDTVLGRAVAVARQVAARIVVVLGPDDADPGLAGVALARDPIAHRGPLAGLVTGLEALGGNGNGDRVVLVLAGDMPRVRPDVLRLLVDALSADQRVGVAHLDSEPVATLPAAVSASVALPAARGLLAADRRSLRALLDSVSVAVVPADVWRRLDPGGETLVDIDTRADLDRA
jgi:molybdopterin-guanine dinucleotide biosynthesis protein A